MYHITVHTARTRANPPWAVRAHCQAAAQANSRKLIKKHQQLSKVALESTRFARQLEPIAQLAHALSADVSSVFRAAWGAAARLPPIPPSAKPLDFPLAEKGVVLVVD